MMATHSAQTQPASERCVLLRPESFVDVILSA